MCFEINIRKSREVLLLYLIEKKPGNSSFNKEHQLDTGVPENVLAGGAKL